MTYLKKATGFMGDDIAKSVKNSQKKNPTQWSKPNFDLILKRGEIGWCGAHFQGEGKRSAFFRSAFSSSPSTSPPPARPPSQISALAGMMPEYAGEVKTSERSSSLNSLIDHPGATLGAGSLAPPSGRVDSSWGESWPGFQSEPCLTNHPVTHKWGQHLTTDPRGGGKLGK